MATAATNEELMTNDPSLNNLKLLIIEGLLKEMGLAHIIPSINKTASNKLKEEREKRELGN